MEMEMEMVWGCLWEAGEGHRYWVAQVSSGVEANGFSKANAYCAVDGACSPLIKTVELAMLADVALGNLTQTPDV